MEANEISSPIVAPGGHAGTATVRWSKTLGAFATAMAKAQGEMGTAKKNATNPHFKNKYADLESILDVARAPLAKNGLAFLQPPLVTRTSAGCLTKIVHTSDEWMECEVVFALAQCTPQAAGSCITYSKRYGAASCLGIPTGEGEDDGNAAEAAAKDEDKGRREAPRQHAAKQSRTEEAKAKLGVNKPDAWQRIVELGALYGKTEEQMVSFCRDPLAGKKKTELTDADVLKIQELLGLTGKPTT